MLLLQRGERKVPEEWYEGAYFYRRAALRFGDCDSRKRASLFTIMKLLSEAAGDDYEGRGFGHSVLLASGQVFLLSRMRLQFSRIPVYAESLVAGTWEREISGPFFCRDYEITGEKNETLVSGSSQWFLANYKTREILRPGSLPLGQRQLNPRKSDCPECRKIRTLMKLPVIGLRDIYYSDLDGNGHVNNAVYGKIAVDYLPDKFRQRDMKSFSINFNLETKADEALEIRGSETENGYIIQGVSGDKIHFCCEFEY
jgi:medium-chain acyl-[acyl-carrier-protein] hydrolase